MKQDTLDHSILGSISSNRFQYGTWRPLIVPFATSRNRGFSNQAKPPWLDIANDPIARQCIVIMGVQEVEKAITGFNHEELAAFRQWFQEFDNEQWDKQIEEDSNSGRMDSLINQALEDYHAGRATSL
jgi:hypothetical protein